MLSDSGNLSSLKTPDSMTHRSMKLQLPSPEQENLRCPRCDSTNTKFCYYNNYNLSQPRHFCKSCRRYWTKGGALRNIPVGGGNRKNNKRPAPTKPLVQSVESEAAQAAVSGQGDGIHDVTGSFGSLLASSGCFGYFGEPYVNLWSLGLGKQEAPVFSSGEPLGYNGTWGMQEMYGSGGIGNSWQSGNNVVVVSNGGEGFENECWAASVWPELAISGPGKSLQ